MLLSLRAPSSITSYDIIEMERTPLFLFSASRLALRSHLLETAKSATAPFAQLLQHDAHISQLFLQLRPTLVVGASVELHVDFALHIGCLLGRVLPHRLRDEFRVEGGLHEGREGVAVGFAVFEGGQKGLGDLFEEEGEDFGKQGGAGGCRGCRWVCGRSGGRRAEGGDCGRDFGVDHD
jgi:hypothetical protein